MAIFKCKMCGGTLEINNNESVLECEYCGTTQTLPKLDNDKKTDLYDRANHFRRNNEFDKAMGIYEHILNEDKTDAEAYWSLVLCRYGIEYVEDPASHKRVPTVNRAQYTSIFDDSNYKAALEYADIMQKSIYEEEAKTINEIQKGILEISQKEEPFDVFICYKETDNNGRRTPDSVLANDLYHQLTQEGFKVFFARITLEDKLGSAYEPYIFAALNSAKVMVVLGTKPDYFKAVWVKNEWSRYLSLIKNGEKKILIPAYKDMDPYDLPEEFSHLQAQDMSKLGFMQDLIRGIKKLTQDDEPTKTVIKEVVNTSSVGADIEPLLKRVFIFLEDSKFEDADVYCEKVLDRDPENGMTYLGKLMAELKIRTREGIKNAFVDNLTPKSFQSNNDSTNKRFDTDELYKKVLRYGDEELVNEIKGCTEYAYETAYKNALDKKDEAKTEKEYKEASVYFKYLDKYKDSEELIQKCLELAKNEKLYCEAVELMNKATEDRIYRMAKGRFEEIIDYKDSKELAEKCEIFAQEIYNDSIYFKALKHMNAQEYSSAIKQFNQVIDWKDSKEKIEECEKAIEQKEREEREEREAKEREHKRIVKRNIIIGITTCSMVVFLVVLFNFIIPTVKYNSAMSLAEEGKHVEAYEILSELDGYSDSAEKMLEIRGKKNIEILKNANVGDYVNFGSYMQNTSEKTDIEWIVLEKNKGKALIISRYALDDKPYNEKREDVTWETCSLRSWLNDDFIEESFTIEEKNYICNSTVKADKITIFDTNPGNDTQDKVFLLNFSEVYKYFTKDSDRMCSATEYAKDEGGYCIWWIRSPGDGQDSAAYVRTSGDVAKYGISVDNGRAVRPALWINLE